MREGNEKELDSLFFTLCDNGLIEQCPNDEIPKSQKLKADGTLIANFESKNVRHVR
ncbi:MAG: hypothetical protein HS129_01950 [Leptospiraceae bacterium]|nr:hypothetical protein [Leptospiraceae bacterium]